MGPPAALKREPLSRLERTLLRFGEQPVSTVTFFRGDLAAAAAGFRERAAAVLRANPWLAGRIRRGHLEWQPEADVDLDRFFRVAERGAVQLSRRTPYPQLSAKLRPYLADSVGTVAAPLFRVSLLPADAAEAGDEAGDAGFALVVSLSHIAGDGYTYYRLLNMLTGAEKVVVAMDTRRKAEVLDAIDELVEVEIMFQPGATLAALAGMARGVWRNRFAREEDKCRVRFHFLDEEHVAAEKKKAKEEGLVDYVSTNDIITSFFLGEMDAGQMAVNFRGRLEGCDADLAGNYESAILYLGPGGDAATPAKVRQSLGRGRYRRVSHPRPEPLGVPPRPGPPGRWLLGKVVGVISNWASFMAPPAIPGCKAALHLPLYDVARNTLGIASLYNFPVCIIFRAEPGGAGAGAGRLGVMIIGFDAVAGPGSGRLRWGASGLLGPPLDVVGL